MLGPLYGQRKVIAETDTNHYDRLTSTEQISVRLKYHILDQQWERKWVDASTTHIDGDMFELRPDIKGLGNLVWTPDNYQQLILHSFAK